MPQLSSKDIKPWKGVVNGVCTDLKELVAIIKALGTKTILEGMENSLHGDCR